MTKRLILFGTAIMTTLLALAAIWQFRTAVIYVLISLAVAATVRPLLNNWSGRSLIKRIGLILLCLAGIGILGLLIFLAGKFTINDIQQLAQSLSVRDEWKLPIWLQGSSFQQALILRLPPPSALFAALTGDQGQLVLPALLGLTEGVGGVLSGLLFVMFLSLYWSVNQIHFERLWLSLLPAEQRKQARNVWRTIEIDLGNYIRSEAAQSLLAGLLLSLGYWLLGSPYPTLLALIGALIWLIPVVGAPLAVIPPLLLGLLTSAQLSLFTALYTLVILIALQVWVEPRVYKRKWDNPILTLVILLIMADTFGLPGMVVAPPLSAVCQILWNILVSNRLNSGAASRVSDLKERQANLQTVLQQMDEQPPQLAMSSMERLAQLMEKAESILQKGQIVETSDLFNPLRPLSNKDGSNKNS